MAKGNKVFRKVLEGTKKNQEPTPKQREAEDRRKRSTERTVRQLEADSRAIQLEVQRRANEEAAHLRAEEDRRKRKG